MYVHKYQQSFIELCIHLPAMVLIKYFLYMLENMFNANKDIKKKKIKSNGKTNYVSLLLTSHTLMRFETPIASSINTRRTSFKRNSYHP